METAVLPGMINVGNEVVAKLGADAVRSLPKHEVACMIYSYKPERDIGTVTVLGDRRQHGILATFDGRDEEAQVKMSYWTYLPPIPSGKDDGSYHPPRIIPDVRLTVRCAKGHTQTAWGSTVYWLHSKGMTFFCSECEGSKSKKFIKRVPTEIVGVIEPESVCHQNEGIMTMVHRLGGDDLTGTVARLPRVWAVIPLSKLPADSMTIDDPFRIQERISRQDRELKAETHAVIPMTVASRFKIRPERVLLEAIQGVGMIDIDHLYGKNGLDYSCRMLSASRVV